MLKKKDGLTFYETLVIFLIIVSITFLSILFRQSIGRYNHFVVFINDGIKVDEKIKNITSNYSDFFKSEHAFSTLFKDHYMINNLKCDFKVNQCSFNKNDGKDEINSDMSANITVSLQEINNNEVLTVLQEFKKFDKLSYEKIYKGYAETKNSNNISTQYYFTSKDNVEKQIDIKNCYKIDNCVFVSKYSQKK